LGVPAGSGAPSPSEDLPAAAPSAPSSPLRPRTRAQAGIHKPKQYTDGSINYGMTVTAEPSSITEELADKNWKKAMDIEYDTLMQNKTWHLVPARRGQNIIDCRWVDKVKRKADRTLDK
jgi:hypothetical protein